jgi:hypothetical protein
MSLQLKHLLGHLTNMEFLLVEEAQQTGLFDSGILSLVKQLSLMTLALKYAI